MGLLVVNSDFERLWNEPYPTISFDNTSYSLAGEVGTELSAAFAITDNYDADVTDQCEITFSNDYVHIEEGQFVCDNLEVGTYQTIATATYSYKSATVTATATINISVEEEQPTSISFNSASYTITGNEHAALSAQFNVEDNLGNDITSLCAYSFLPNDKGVYAEGGYFKVDSAVAGTYNITVTATYGQLTNTATIAMSVVDYPDSISFDSNSYTMSGDEGDTITQAFTVTDDLNNDVTSMCSYSFSPNNTGLIVSGSSFDASNVAEGTYSVTVTATYASGNGSTLTATATISIEVQSASFANKYLTFEALESGTFTLTVPSVIDSTFMTSISYSTDNGTTWVDTTIDNTNQTITTPTINAGDNVLWKGEGKAYKKVYNNTPSNFTSTGNFNISGNIMSLVYDDNFRNQTTFPSGSTYTFTSLFNNNTKLISAENLSLPATTLVEGCYGGMFSGCTSLTKVPALPATTLATACYGGYNNQSLGMFENCTSLTTVPELPATTLAISCYHSMFSGCTGITSVPSNYLPATTLASGCYHNMFQNCTSLTTAPALPATTLASGCYQGMFSGCTGLTTAPALPATTLASGCYQGMFKGCTNLTTAPTLPATTLAYECYGSSNPNYPNGMFENCTSLTTVPELPATTLATGCYGAMFKGCTGITSVPSNYLPATSAPQSCYLQMFEGCTSLTNAPELPATTLESSACYQRMFRGCTSLTTAPTVLPATTLPRDAYGSMFAGCTSLTTAPEISATNFDKYSANNCGSMFYNCTSLTKAPTVLPATTLIQGCYGGMFENCTSLTTAPVLPATTLNSESYRFMFSGCTSLNNITMLATNISAANCLNNWVQNVAATGTFTKAASMTTLPTGKDGIPSGWTVVDEGGTSIPEGLHKFVISQSQWPDCAMMVEAYYNPGELKKGETGSETVNIYTDPSGEPINSITYNGYVIGGETETDVQNTNFNAGVYCSNSSDWMPYTTNPLAFKLECSTAGTYYIEVVDHTDPRFYDANGSQIYPDNA